MKIKKKVKRSETAIVFGGAGFLGSHVCDELSSRGYRVKIFDIKRSAFLRPGQEMIEGNILNPSEVLASVKGCDFIYNFAGFANLDDAGTKPMDTFKLNVMGNLNIMDAALQVGAQRFIYASTIYVYSEKGGFYRCSKQSSELYLEEYQRKWGLEFTILRYGTLYGPRADVRNSVYRYLQSALTQHNICYPGTGDEVRDYIHVRDAARLSVDVLADDYRNEHIIISGQHPIQFKELAKMVQEILGRKIRIQTTRAQVAGHYNYTPCSFIPKIGNKLTSRLYVDMGQGLLECLHEIQALVTRGNSSNVPIRQLNYTRKP